MTILFGHPTGNPNSHHAALAYFEARQLEAFCVPWMPSSSLLQFFDRFARLQPMMRRFARRHFAPLADAPKSQGRAGELLRLVTRAAGYGDERQSYQANDWLMRTMRRECRRPAVTAVHAYEDCSLWQFEEAKRLGKACIYDMPIGYYPAWERTQAQLAAKYAEWVSPGGLSSDRYVRPRQKHEEMELADIVLAPSGFVAETILEFNPGKRVEIAPYGVDADDWRPPAHRVARDGMTFLFVGACSLRKGVPLLLEAWRGAALKHARLQLVGSWQLAPGKQSMLPPRTVWEGPVSADRLLHYYQHADVLVLPSHFEGRALVVGEALASGLPVLTTYSSGTQDLINDSCGRLLPAGNLEALVEGLRWFERNRALLPSMANAARARAERCTWENYRERVRAATSAFV
jgi:alpha-maltose-1-phosphate synthase